MQQIILVIHLVLAFFLVGFILLQQGKGADAGAAFGAGASGTVFGSRGSGNFLSRTTSLLAFLFFCTSCYLAYFAAQGVTSKSIVESLSEPQSEVPSLTPNEVPTLPAGDVPSLPDPVAPESEDSNGDAPIDGEGGQ
ncbi:MAG: preprotein translocase subunit SecG [Pseudomonadota bacterium]